MTSAVGSAGCGSHRRGSPRGPGAGRKAGSVCSAHERVGLGAAAAWAPQHARWPIHAAGHDHLGGPGEAAVDGRVAGLRGFGRCGPSCCGWRRLGGSSARPACAAAGWPGRPRPSFLAGLLRWARGLGFVHRPGTRLLTRPPNLQALRRGLVAVFRWLRCRSRSRAVQFAVQLLLPRVQPAIAWRGGPARNGRQSPGLHLAVCCARSVPHGRRPHAAPDWARAKSQCPGPKRPRTAREPVHRWPAPVAGFGGRGPVPPARA